MLLGAGALSSQAAIYFVGDFTVYNSETGEDVTTHREIEMPQFEGDVYCFWLYQDGRVNNIQIKDTDSDEIVYGAESDGDFKINSTQTWSLAAGTGNVVKLSDASAGSTLIDFFYDKVNHKLTMVDKNVPLHVRGTYNAWGFNDDDLILNYEGSGVYKLRYTSLKTISNFTQFAIASEDWSVKYGVSDTETDKISFSSAKTLVDGGNNAEFDIDFIPNYFELVFNALTKQFTAQVPLWLRGSNYGGYEIKEENRFKPSAIADNVYVLDLGQKAAMTGKFKVADENWSQPFNFGDAYGDGNVYRLNYTGGGDIDCSTISTPETQLLYVAFFEEKEEVKCNLFMGLPSQLYLNGWANVWSTSNLPYTLQPNSEQPWIYENVEELSLEGINNFRIFDNTTNDDWYKTSWGHYGEKDGFEPTFSANGQDATVDMIKGWGNNIMLDSEKRKGPFFFSFNILTGKLKIKNTDTSSVSEVADDSVKIIAANGVISAEDALIDVYTVSGACVARQAEKVNAANGLYIVVANGKAQKVVLK